MVVLYGQTSDTSVHHMVLKISQSVRKVFSIRQFESLPVLKTIISHRLWTQSETLTSLRLLLMVLFFYCFQFLSCSVNSWNGPKRGLRAVQYFTDTCDTCYWFRSVCEHTCEVTTAVKIERQDSVKLTLILLITSTQTEGGKQSRKLGRGNTFTKTVRGVHPLHTTTLFLWSR